MRLYRGFIIDLTNDTDAFRSKSSVNINEMLLHEPDLDPHSFENANKFLWATPDEQYAKLVNIARFITMMTFDTEFADKVSAGKIKMAIATYDVSETNIFEAGSKIIRHFLPDCEQYIIQNVDGDMTVSTISPESYQAILDLMNAEGHTDTISRATPILEITRGVTINWAQEGIKVDQMTFVAGLRYIINKYFQDVMTNESSFELIAEGLFAGPFILYRYAGETTYNQEIHEGEYEPEIK